MQQDAPPTARTSYGRHIIMVTPMQQLYPPRIVCEESFEVPWLVIITMLVEQTATVLRDQ